MGVSMPPPVQSTSEYLVDVTESYIDSRDRLAHHARKGSPLRTKTIPYASVGYRWRQSLADLIPCALRAGEDALPLLSGDRPQARKRSCRSWLQRLSVYGLFGFFTALGIIQFISITCGIVLSFFPNDYDRAAWAWRDVIVAEVDDITRWPTDFSRDIIAVDCHSHNDYLHSVPLFLALQAGCTGVEADVWLVDDELYVGHTSHGLTKRRTLRTLYIDPLVALLDRQNSITPLQHVIDRAKNGIFDTDPAQTLVLLIDFKSDGATTWPAVVAHLAPLRDRGYLTYFDGRTLVPGPVTVVGSGNAPFDLLSANATYRDIFFDAPLEKLVDDSALWPPLGTIATDTYNTTNSYYASVSFKAAVGFPWPFHLTPRQIDLIRTQVRVAHHYGLKVRYWDVPNWPRSLRNHIWRVLVQEGVDMLNVDDLVAATQGNWRNRVFDWWW
ncbi:hypothetical protein N7462_005838 [Penicillium macrosclerotiorum]|uniref:uncharacterized protein n=1 Tax=Penicillium macrosclerotiorum TaxID=303699 RepID=UPI002549993A|nr:uncharacterized protein N7462_005838 [Penicillium macrosclerotiorum]KAJ5682673.1 hypothetical protein N7462_005838 [Penicillium macrosclerotiorum]